MKNILKVAFGVIISSIIILLLETLGHKIFPVANFTGSETKDQIRLIMESLPIGAFISVLISYFIGTFTGAFILSFISKSDAMKNSIKMAIILEILGIINLFMIPHPIWFVVVSVLLYLPAGFLGAYIYIMFFNK